MALSSASTLAEIEAAYDDNASYQETGSAAQAAAFISACTLLVRRYLSMQRSGDQEMQRDPRLIRADKLEAQQWLASVGTAGRHKHVSFGQFRD